MRMLFLLLARVLGWLGVVWLGLVALTLPAGSAAPIRPAAGEAHQTPAGQFLFKQFAAGDQQIDDLSLRGWAAIPPGNTVLRLTSTITDGQSGAVWHMTRQMVGDGFDTTFDFQISGAQSGADGLAFVVHNDQRGLETLGIGGCSMGYGDIKAALAVEFDTYLNNYHCAETFDPDGNHVGVLSGGTGPLRPNHTPAYNLGTRTLPSTIQLKAGFHTARISYAVEDGAGLLQVYVDDLVTPLLSIPVDLAAKLGLSDGTAWVGLVAGTGTSRQNHDIANWFFVDSWDLSCVTYDFTLDNNPSQGFMPDVDHKTGWPGQGSGWTSVGGRLSMSRGVINTGKPILDPNDLIDQRLVRLIRDQHQPILAVQGQFFLDRDNGDQVTETVDLQIDYELKTPSGLLSGSQLTQVSISGDLNAQDEIFTFRVPIREQDIASAADPSGLRIKINSPSELYAIRLKRGGVCLDAGMPDRPGVVAPGAGAACATLKANLQTRTQPFGPAGSAEQPEFPFGQTSAVDLVPFPEYSIDLEGFPDLMTYGRMPPGHAPVACVFMQNGAIYNPRSPATPVVRFTAVGANQYWRESLILLNYAAYFSHTLKQWCAHGDNVYRSINDRGLPEKYGPGYNVPTPHYPCDDVGFNESSDDHGPCGTFAGSLFRAMGFFNAAAFGQALWHSETPGVAGNLYYGPIPYNNYALPQNKYHQVDQPLVRVDFSSQASYAKELVTFEGLRIYPHRAGARRYVPVAETYTMGWLWWDNSAADEVPVAEKVPSPHDRTLATDPEEVWRRIKPGDIAITVVQTKEITTTTIVDKDIHISIVVGWGPQQFSTSAWRGDNLYPTYSSLPYALRSTAVPYVMDRFSVLGTGNTAGPRPFNHQISHTATDFWVSSHAMPMAPIGNPAALMPPSVDAPTPAVSAPETPALQSLDVEPSLAWNPVSGQLAAGGSFGLRLTGLPFSLTTRPVAAASVVDLAWNPAGTLLASAEAAQRITIRQPDGKVRAVLAGHRAMPMAVAWKPDGSLLASSGRDQRILLWDSSWQIAGTIAYTGDDTIRALAWSPDGSAIAGSDSASIWIWSASGEIQRILPLKTSPYRSLQWSADGQALITVRGQRLDRLSGQETVTSMACSSGDDTVTLASPSGGRLAGAGESPGGVEACLQTLDAAGRVQSVTYLQTPANSETVSDVAWSADGRQVVTVSRDGWLARWDSATGGLVDLEAAPDVTREQIKERISRCVFLDSLQLGLHYQVDQGDYAGLASLVEARRSLLDRSCANYLAALATHLRSHPPVTVSPPAPVQVAPTVAAWCAPDSATRFWTISNPNPFDLVVGWGWSNQAPVLVERWIVVPAARGGVPGRWRLDTPVGAGDLRLVSGGFAVDAPWSAGACRALQLPRIIR